MRIRNFIAALAVLAAFAVALPQSASAGARHHKHRHDGCCHHRAGHHVRHSLFDRRSWVDGDPYRYRPAKVRYYPSYNAHYWVPARCYRRKIHYTKKPRYQQAWDYPKRGQHHHHHRRR